MGDVISSARSYFLHDTSMVCHGSRAAAVHRVEFQCGQSYQTSQILSNPAPGWRHLAPGLARLAGLMLKCRESSDSLLKRGQQYQCSWDSRAAELPLVWRQSSHSLRSSQGPVTRGVSVWSGPQSPTPATTKVSLCSRDLYNAPK